MPHVLLLCEFATLNGGERSMLATLDGIREAGFSIVVAGPPAGPLAETLRRRGVEVEPFCARPGGTGGLSASGTHGLTSSPCHPSQARLRKNLAALIARRRPDLVHANSLSMGRLSGPVVAELGIPSIAHLRDIIKLSRQGVADLNRHTRLLAVSEATSAFHVAQHLDAGKLGVLYTGVDLVEFAPGASSGFLHRELGLAGGAPLVGTIGQIGLRKGQDVLARAAVRIAAQVPDVHFLIVGERNSAKAESLRFEAALRRAAEQMPGRFHFLGRRGDVPRLLNELTLLVHPARQEPLGRVLLEAAASGVAVVATEVGGTAEVFPPGSGAALLVPPDDPEALADAVLKVLRDRSRRESLGAAARRRAKEAFDADRAARALARHYREVVGSRLAGG